MAYNFKNIDRETPYLMPPSLKEWLRPGHLAWFILEAVRSMDLSKFYAEYRSDGRGGEAYDPEAMVALLLYSYCLGERSSRKIEGACEVDVAYRVLTGNYAPDYSTICRFRARHEAALKGLFLDGLRMCRAGGMGKAGRVALDGTKMKANAAKSANRSYDHLKDEIDRMFEEARRVDEEEDRLYGKDRRGDELPEHLQDPEKRREWMRQEMEKIRKEAQAYAARQAEKIAKRAWEEARTGKKKRGRKPSAPDPTPDGELKLNMTDPQSRLMKTRDGYVQGYNAQAVVTEDQIIIAAEVTQDCNDLGQLHPMLGLARENLAKAGGKKGEMKVALADAGYWSEANAKGGRRGGPELLIATNKDWKQRKAMREAPPPRGRMPHGMTARDKMERKLLTKRGRALYKLRGQTVEPVFGQTKDGRGCERFMRRGKQAADGEWSLLCTTHNLLKLWRRGKAKLARIFEGMRLGGAMPSPAYA